MGRKHRRLQTSEAAGQPDIRRSFDRPQQTTQPKMASGRPQGSSESEMSPDEEGPVITQTSSGVYRREDSDSDTSPSTKGDIKRLLLELRGVWKKDLDGVRGEIGGIVSRLGAVETRGVEKDSSLAETRTKVADLTQQLQRLTRAVTAMEVRHRRKNIRIRGVPETVGPESVLEFSNKVATMMAEWKLVSRKLYESKIVHSTITSLGDNLQEEEKPGSRLLNVPKIAHSTITSLGDNLQEEEKPGSRLLYVPNIVNSTITALSDNQTFILAPYYDPRGPTLSIRVLAIIHHSVRELYCWFHCIHSSSVTVRAQIDLHRDRFGYPYGTADLLCTEPPKCTYHYISVHWSNATNITQLPLFEVRNRPPHTLSVNFTVCISTMYGDFNNVLQTIQSIEMYKLLGAGRVTLYVNKCHENVDKVLQYYVEEGILEVVPWPIDKFLRTSREWHYNLNSTNQIGYYGQTATLNDCLYRNMYRSKFVFLNDIDEIILPMKHRDWKSLMQSLQKQYPESSVFRIENYFFPKHGNGYELNKWKDIPGINILLHTFREQASKKMVDARKLIVDPIKVYQTSIHNVIKNNGKATNISNKTAIVFHARKTGPRFGQEFLKKDRTMKRYSESLIRNVDKVIHQVFSHH
ncbi:uncharacterized protein LOC134615252 [Pelobates fuscus]|uniref:uncharacterized protein LOC134615252 n=1 Tax=Pelobates fuscus TaxID=191477 RepID=UPI002FE4A22B